MSIEERIGGRGAVFTPHYAAPEIIRGFDAKHSAFQELADVYSFGIILFQLCTGVTSLYGDLWSAAVLEQVSEQGLRPIFPEGCAVHAADRSLIQRCWAQEPSQRPSFAEIAYKLR